jgi:3'(2'), 5'-bisphosphate nucleotidase
MLQKELETAIALARLAGKNILSHYQTDYVTEEKLGIDNFYEPVTIADKEASRIIVDGLIAAFPDDGVLSEEEPDDKERLSKRRVWIIDPLDGTAGFVRKDGDFAVQIGLAEDGVGVLGVVLLPFYDTLYYAFKGGGAFQISGAPARQQDAGVPARLAVSGKTDFTTMKLASSRNHRSPRLTRVINDLGIRTEEQRGSVGLKVGLIGTQVCDLYIHLSPRTKLWDTCAPEVILREAGGKLTDLFGSPIRYDVRDVQNHNGILATNGVSHDSIIEHLKPLLREFGRLRVKSGN